MPIFPVISAEDLVQSGDKTRIDGSKSFASGASKETAVLIRPSADEAFYATDNGTLDWIYDHSGPDDPMPVTATVRATSTVTVDDSNDKIEFRLSANPNTILVATIAHGDYSSYLALFTAIADALSAATATPYPSLDWEVLVDVDVVQIHLSGMDVDSGDTLTLLVTGGDLPGASMLPLLGFEADLATTIAPLATEVMPEGTVVPGALFKDLSKVLNIVTAVTDNLFSDDDRLRKHEWDILKFVPDGRASFLDVHRRAQQLIMAWMDTQGFLNDFEEPFRVQDIKNPEDFREWATMMVLRLIFEGLHNAKDDVFQQKAEHYQALEDFFRNRANVRIDLNKDGTVDVTERLDTRSCVVVRR